MTLDFSTPGAGHTLPATTTVDVSADDVSFIPRLPSRDPLAHSRTQDDRFPQANTGLFWRENGRYLFTDTRDAAITICVTSVPFLNFGVLYLCNKTDINSKN